MLAAYARISLQLSVLARYNTKSVSVPTAVFKSEYETAVMQKSYRLAV